MKSSLRFVLLLSATGLPVAARGAETAPATEHHVTYTPEQKAALDALDAELGRFDAKAGLITDGTYKAEIRIAIERFKKRRTALRQAAFDQGKYDELRFEINVEYQRVANWLRGPITPQRAKNAP